MSAPARERGLVIIVVLMVIVLGALVGSSLLLTTDAERVGAANTVARVQARATAWSGLQAAMAEIAEQRDELIRGGEPDLTSFWTLFEDSDGRRAVVRILPIENGKAAVSEAARLDLNTATRDMLAALPMVSESLADRIVAARDEHPITSVESLLTIEGVTHELLYGSDESGASGPDANGTGADAALSRFVTVFSFDPTVQSGVDGEEYVGRRRINLNTTWSDGLADAISERWGSAAAAVVRELFESGSTFEQQSDIARALNQGVAPAQWGGVLDAFAATEDEFVPGLVDLNRAPALVLACLPGIDEEHAQQIVDLRERLGEAALINPVWPLVEGVLDAERMIEAIDFVTTRSLQWRVRIEVGYIASGSDDQTAAEARDRELGRLTDEEPLQDAMTIEAVIDAGSQRVRVAYLRDITMLPIARAFRTELAVADPDGLGRREADPFDDPESDVLTDDEAADENVFASGRPRDGVQRQERLFAERETPVEEDEARVLGMDAPGTGAAPEPARIDPRLGRWTPGGGGR